MSVSIVTISDNRVNLYIPVTANAVDTVTVSYTGGANPIRDSAGNSASALDSIAAVPRPRAVSHWPSGSSNTYTVTIPSGGVKDANGVALQNPYSFTFTTGNP